jgi:hypothetical protein
MRKRHLAPALLALVALGVAIAVKLFAATTSPVYARQSGVAPTHMAPVYSPIATMKSVPALVIDPDAGYFVRTGDARRLLGRPNHHAR